MEYHAGHISIHLDNASSGIECCKTRASTNSAEPCSYGKHLDSNLPEWPEYWRLGSYLHTPWKDTEFHTRVLVGSPDQMTISFRGFLFDSAHKDRVEAELMKLSVTLQNFPQNKGPVLLFVESPGSNFCSAVIDIIGRILDVDPLFFDIAILYEMCAYRDIAGTEYFRPRPPISRDRGILWLHDKLVAQIVTKEHSGEDIPYVLIFANTKSLYPDPHMHIALLKPPPSYNRPEDLSFEGRKFFSTQASSCPNAGYIYMELLSKLQAHEIQEARQNPCLFMFPWIYFLAQDLSITICMFLNDHHDDPREKGLSRAHRGEPDLPQATGWLSHVIDNFGALIRDLQATAPYNQTPESPSYRRLLGYCTEVHTEGNRLLQAIREKKQLDIGLWSIKESQRSIEEAVAVKRLTQLAFIFIPLSFTTSVFGMNINEITGTGAKLSTFLATAVCIGIAVGLMWWLFGKVEQWWKEHPPVNLADQKPCLWWISWGVSNYQLGWMMRNGTLTALLTGGRFGHGDYESALQVRQTTVGKN